jgi:LPXTG-motif cell wall-anchored protein
LMLLAAMLAMALVAAAPALAQVVEEFEIEEAESGGAAPELTVENAGDNVNLCAAVLQAAQTGNVQNIQAVQQYGVEESDDIEFSGSGITISPELEQACEQSIQQAAAAGEKGEAKAGKAEAKAGEAKAEGDKAEAKAGKAEVKELPKTGGAAGSASLLALGAGALLVAGGLLARRMIR